LSRIEGDFLDVGKVGISFVETAFMYENTVTIIDKYSDIFWEPNAANSPHGDTYDFGFTALEKGMQTDDYAKAIT